MPRGQHATNRWRERRNRRRPSNSLKGRTYKKRASTLKRLGYESYSAYLKSDLWKRLRGEVLERYQTCELCSKASSAQVHHIAYNMEVLSGKNKLKLVAVCEPCHLSVEFKEDGSKREFEATMKRTRKLLRKNGRWRLHIRQKPQAPVERRKDNVVDQSGKDSDSLSDA